MPITTLVNLKNSKCEVKIDRTGPFGNPHRHGYCYICNKIHDRDECIEAYKIDFHKLILTDTEFRDKVLALKGHVLGCWCWPLNCHGMVIIEYLEGIPYKTKPKDKVEFFEV